MKISFNWLKQYIKLTESPEEIAALLTGSGLEVEGIEKAETTPGSLSEPDYVFEIGLTPNRADGASHLGVARDLRALLNRPIQWPSVEEFATDKLSRAISVSVENYEACPRYSSLTMTHVTVKDSPEWLKTRLKAIGINPTNNVVDVTNYVLHSFGQPMHAFDADAVTGDRVMVKTLPEGSKFTTLDEKERSLSSKDLMICNAEEGMCMAGVFGGTKSGMKESTKNIFLESAFFSADYIRRTAQKHQLKTDASFRYERGTDPNITVYALKYAAMLIKEVAGGEIASEISDLYPKPIAPFRVPVKYAHIDRLIGKHIENQRVHEILTLLDIEVTENTETDFVAMVPPYRVDVQREADIIEEILRIYGLNNIETGDCLSSTFLSQFPEKDADNIQKETTRILAGAGFNEIVTNSLTREGYSKDCESIDEEQNVHILNYLSEDLTVMRQNLLFHGLEVIDRNIKRRQTDLRLYEFGTTYHLIKGKYVERPGLAIFITGKTRSEHWLEPNRPVHFHDLAAIVKKLLNKFGIDLYDTSELTNSLFSYGITYSVNKRPLAHLGKVKPKQAQKAEVKAGVFYADFDWQYLCELYETEFACQPISKFPEVRRDLSLVIDKSVHFEDIRKISLQLEQSLIRRINVFDVYEGENIDDGKKAYAVSFFLQDNEKTLTDKVIDKTLKRLMQGFESQLGAMIRK